MQRFAEILPQTQANLRYNRVMVVSVGVLCIVASPAMRGSTPLDVAASSVMDNNGLALALEEPDLDKVRRSLIATILCICLI